MILSVLLYYVVELIDMVVFVGLSCDFFYFWYEYF